MLRSMLYGLAILLVACRPSPKTPPVPVDTTVVEQPDSLNVDTSMYTPDDTLNDGLDESRAFVPDTLPTPPRGLRQLAITGLPIGPSAIPTDQAKQYRITGSWWSMEFRWFGPQMRTNAQTGIRSMLVFQRKYQTTNGESYGFYSVRNAWKYLDELVKAFPPDSMRKYYNSGHLAGFVLMDDMGCTHCWGRDGNTVSAAQVDSVYRYAKTKFPSFIPLGIRVHPTWLAKLPGISRSLDFAWAQYVEQRGDQLTWYKREAAYAAQLPHPIKVAYGVNVMHIDQYRNSATAAELGRYLPTAVNFPGNCFVMGWRHWAGWRDGGRGAAWDGAIALARTKPTPTCDVP